MRLYVVEWSDQLPAIHRGVGAGIAEWTAGRLSPHTSLAISDCGQKALHSHR